MDKFATAFHEAAHAVIGILATRECPARITIKGNRARNVSGTTSFPPWAICPGNFHIGPEIPEKVRRLFKRRHRHSAERTVLIYLAGPAQDTQRDPDWEAQGFGDGADLAFFYSECGDVKNADALLAEFESNRRRRAEWLSRLADRTLRLLRRKRIFKAVERLAVTLYRCKTLADNDLVDALSRAERTCGWPWKKSTRANWRK